MSFEAEHVRYIRYKENRGVDSKARAGLLRKSPCLSVSGSLCQPADRSWTDVGGGVTVYVRKWSTFRGMCFCVCARVEHVVSLCGVFNCEAISGLPHPHEG